MENDANIEDDKKNMNLQDDEIFDQFIKVSSIQLR